MARQFEIGQAVVRSKGDYVVGRTGNVVALDIDKGRVQVAWIGNATTWVSVNSIELTSIPYKIVRHETANIHKPAHPKYVRTN